MRRTENGRRDRIGATGGFNRKMATKIKEFSLSAGELVRFEHFEMDRAHGYLMETGDRRQ